MGILSGRAEGQCEDRSWATYRGRAQGGVRQHDRVVQAALAAFVAPDPFVEWFLSERIGFQPISSLPSDTIGTCARRHDPALHMATLRYRRDVDLPFDPDAAPALPLLLDTTVYLDRSAGRLPRNIRKLIAARQHLVYNCGVVCAELAISVGLLNPADLRTAGTITADHAHMDQMEKDKTVAPSAEAWTEAAVLAGILARTQGLAVAKRSLTPTRACCQEGRRRELLLDALLYMTAIEKNMLLLSGNIRHMDLLMQLRPAANVLLYRPS